MQKAERGSEIDVYKRQDVYDETTAPKTIDDLTDPRFEGQVGMADPGVAAPAYPLAAQIMDSKGMEGGQEYFTTLFEQGLMCIRDSLKERGSVRSSRSLRW